MLNDLKSNLNQKCQKSLRKKNTISVKHRNHSKNFVIVVTILQSTQTNKQA